MSRIVIEQMSPGWGEPWIAHIESTDGVVQRRAEKYGQTPEEALRFFFGELVAEAVATVSARRSSTNVCEHGDHPAPEGRRFCSDACAKCEHESTGEDGCDGICLLTRGRSRDG